jgi:UDP-2-acetamido-3-amino-2,3-dideoxy-glucuronate N-acetyltransferase
MVGAGYWGKKLLPKFIKSELSRVKIVCDKVPASRAEISKNFPEIATTDSFQELLEDSEVQALVIVTPPATHFALARQAMVAGKHVWIEKPLALRLNEGRELVRLARAAGTVLFVDHTFLYDPAVRTIRELIRQGELGEIYHIFSQRLNLGRIKRDSNVWWNSAPHDVSIILYLVSGRPAHISLQGYRYLQANLEDLNMAVLEMDNGTSAFIYHNWLYPENTAKLTVVGSKRLLVYEGKFDKRAVVLYDYEVENTSNRLSLDKLPTTIPSKIISERKLEGIYDQEPLALAVSDFLQSIESHQAPLSDGEFSLKVLACLEAGEESLGRGGTKVLVAGTADH